MNLNIPHLLRIEWMKVKNYKAFWILMILFVVSMIGINYIYWYVKQQFVASGDIAAQAAGSMIFGDFRFPAVFKTVSQMSSWLLYFPGFIVIFHTTNEFTFRTHRQNIIDGLMRKQFVVAKLAGAFLLALVCTLLILLTSLVFGLISGDGYFSLEGLQYIGFFFVQSCVYILFAFTLALLVRRAALAVGIFFIYGLIFDYLLAVWISRGTETTLGYYLMPLQVADELNPPLAELKKVIGSTNQWIALGISIAWLAFYCFFPIRKFEREDL
ncbi:MAG: ABC transporter permease [Chitinophagaceae bacterium]|jgi:hypothetical protein|nr:ABC transporter permease [Chitinophagaceae bacterium]